MNIKISRENYLLEGFDRILSPTGKLYRRYQGKFTRKPEIRLKTFADDAAKLRNDWGNVGFDLIRAAEKSKAGVK